jgi:glycerol-3-phosphate dehydrogenase
MSSSGEPPEPQTAKNITVIGAGAFGTALAQTAARNGNKVTMYARNQEVVDKINNEHINPHYLSEFELSSLISATSSVQESINGADFVILAIPTQLVSAFFLLPIQFLTFVSFLLFRFLIGWLNTKI